MSEAATVDTTISSEFEIPVNIKTTITTRRFVSWKIINAFRYVLPYPRKMLNYIAVKRALFTQNPSSRFYPLKLGVEASSRCNLKCPLCPRTENPNRPIGDMDFDSFVKLVDNLSPFLFHVRFHSLGEPTLNPRLPVMVEYAHKKGVYTNFHTNGHFLTENLCRDLISSGLDEVNIALDGLTEDVYKKYRIGGSSDRVKEGIVRFCNIKRELKSRSPRVNLQFLVMSHNEHEISDLYKFASLAGVDWVFLKTVNLMHGIDSGNKSYLPTDPKYSRYKYENSNLELNKKFRCSRTYSELIVNWDGTVSLCVTDDPQSGIIKGNVFKDGIENVWFGNDFENARHKSLKMEYEMCSCCDDAQCSV